MNNKDLFTKFQALSTPLVADACLRLKITPRTVPVGIRPIVAGTPVAGRVLPVRHYGSVDVFLEAMHTASPGDVLVIDNGGRSDEGCIGDLTAIEAMANKIAAIIVCGTHRDTPELIKLGLPIYSYGSMPLGPMRLDTRGPDALKSARFGETLVSSEDAVFADDDGVVFAPLVSVMEILRVAAKISGTEKQQAEDVRKGKTLFQQLDVAEFISKRETDPSYTFRQHLRTIGGAIEE